MRDQDQCENLVVRWRLNHCGLWRCLTSAYIRNLKKISL